MKNYSLRHFEIELQICLTNTCTVPVPASHKISLLVIPVPIFAKILKSCIFASKVRCADTPKRTFYTYFSSECRHSVAETAASYY